MIEALLFIFAVITIGSICTAMKLAASARDARQVIANYERDLAALRSLQVNSSSMPHVRFVYHPSTDSVSGDFFVTRPLEENGWVFVVGDVESHGVKAASCSFLVHGILVAAGDKDLVSIATALDKGFKSLRTVATAVVGIYRETREGAEIQYLACEHPWCVLIHNGIPTLSRSVGAPALGTWNGYDKIAPPVTVKLSCGQSFCVLTDGVVESMLGGLPVGYERLLGYISSAHGSAIDAVRRITSCIGGATRDDILLAEFTAH